MNALVKKELREQLKVAVVAFIAFAILIFITWSNYSSLMREIPLRPQPGDEAAKLQPLSSDSFAGFVPVLCAIFGLALGWLQIFSERHRDLWAFLVHRPMTRAQVFQAKACAGLFLYTITAGLPLAAFIFWARWPGHVAAPFEWSMVVPTAGAFLAGIAYYFVGMVTGLRRARWYGTKVLAIGVGLLASGVALTGSVWAIPIPIVCALAVAMAAWGSFHSHGHYEGQPTVGKVALISSLTVGIAFLVIGAVIQISMNCPGLFRTTTWSGYVMTKNGSIFKQITGFNRQPEIVDLNGKPVIDSKTGRPVDTQSFFRQIASSIAIDTRPDPRMRQRTVFSLWRITPTTLWYYWHRHGRLAGYDAASRRFIGSIGPNGFAATLAGQGDRFLPLEQGYYWWGFATRTLASTSAVHQIDLDDRTTTMLFTAGTGDSVAGAKDFSSNGYDREYTVVATRKVINLLTPDGKVIAQTPYQPASPDYSLVQVSFLEPAGNFAVWFQPSWMANQQAGNRLPTHLLYLAKNSEVTKQTELPGAGAMADGNRAMEFITAAASPPGFVLAAVAISRGVSPAFRPWELLFTSLLSAVIISVPIGWRIGRRYAFGKREQAGWAIFHLLLGLPGLVAFLAVHEWPARVPCQNCKRRRTVDRDKCEHCGAGFPPPEKTGVEIFEPLGPASDKSLVPS